MQKYAGKLVFLSLALIIFISGYLHLKSMGLYGDDWGASTYVFQPNIGGAVKEWWNAGSGEIGNFRFLAVIIPILWYILFAIFGQIGPVILNFLVFTLLAYLFFKILQNHVSTTAAFFGAVLFALYPTNNAYFWQVTLSYDLAMLAVFSAIIFYYKNKIWQTILLLIISLLLNEAVFFVFALALLPPKTLEFLPLKNNFKSWLKVVLPILIIYALVRVGVEAFGLIGDSRAVNSLHSFQLFSYLKQFVTGQAVVLIISYGLMLWKLRHSFMPVDIIIGLLCGSLVFWQLIINKGTEAVNSIGSKINYLLILGIILIFAGRYYGFYYVPSINVLNLDSRYYFAASVGGALFFTAIFQWLMIKVKPNVIIGLASGLIIFLGMLRWEVQRDYVTAYQSSSLIWQQILSQVKSPADDLFLVIDIPQRTLGNPVGLFEAMGDLRVLAPRLYDSSIVAVSTPYIQNLNKKDDNWCLNSSPFYLNKCFSSKNTVQMNWKNNQLILVNGDLNLLNSGTKPAHIPINFYKVLNISK